MGVAPWKGPLDGEEPPVAWVPTATDSIREATEWGADQQFRRLLVGLYAHKGDEAKLNFVLLMLRYYRGQIALRYDRRKITFEMVKKERGELSDDEIQSILTALRWFDPRTPPRVYVPPLRFMIKEVEKRLKGIREGRVSTI